VTLYTLITLNFETCALLCCYAAHSCDSLPTFLDNLWVPSSMAKHPRSPCILEPSRRDDRLPQNVGRELQLYAAQQHRRVQFSLASRRKPDFTRTELHLCLRCSLRCLLLSVLQALLVLDGVLASAGCLAFLVSIHVNTFTSLGQK